MKLEDIVLVRATKSHLPLNGELRPSCYDRYLKKGDISDYNDLISQKIKEYQKEKYGKVYKLWEEKDRKEFSEIKKLYSPYTSVYTSTLSFSLNGLVPDDMNNFFSDYKVAVLDPLKPHLDDTDFVNFHVIDTTTKGIMKVSDSAILVIDKTLYESLNSEIKNNLNRYYKIETFEGDLKSAVSHTLRKYGYPALPLIQRVEENYIEDCPEKQSMIKMQEDVAKYLDISTLRLFYLYTSNSLDEFDQKSQNKIIDEKKNIETVKKYYRDLFYNFLEEKAKMYGLDLEDGERFYLYSKFSNSKTVLSKLVDYVIESCGGLEMFKGVIEEFNNYVLNNYLTNDEIVKKDSGSFIQ